MSRRSPTASRVDASGDSTSLADRKRNAGQRLIIGFEQPFVDDDLRRLVRIVQPAGFILFKRNVLDPLQVRELNRELSALVDPSAPALITVDQEGGRVQRVRAPATEWPDALTVARAGLVPEVSEALAVELRAMGFNLNLAPVADVHSNPANPVIGDRAFATDPAAAAAEVARFIHAHHGAGVATCAKHFPGHGDTHLDSHHDLPAVDAELRRLETRELVPFAAAVRAGVASIMTAHVVFPALDPSLPATLSPVVIPRLLRKRMGFSGVVFSDDMEMKAVHGRYPVDQQLRLATEATVDVLLCCRSPSLQLEAFEGLVHLQESERAAEHASATSAGRVHALRERFFLGKKPPPPLSIVGCQAHRSLAHLALARGDDP